MHEQGDATSPEGDIRAARDARRIQSKAQASGVKVLPDTQFRSGVSPPDACHHP
jgi:hypothetical protein